MLKLSQEVLNRRVWNQPIYKSHIRDFMLGQTKDYISKDKNVIDIGAAVGMYSFFFSQCGKHVYSFEAVPPVFKQLQITCEKTDNISAYNLAVSNHSGRSSFFVDDKRLSNSSFQNLVDGQEIEVDVVTVDSMDFKNVGFIKIDTEGTEFEVIEGAKQTIERDRPNCMVEVYGKFAKYPPEEIFSFFFDRDYFCFYNSKGSGLVKVDNKEKASTLAVDENMINVHDGDFLFIDKENGCISSK
jgi:FkbM family methyltransferase|tara:strand:+ start:1468 stop:2193 length:726 start_codon:yes stop_codon:yes gene_type:complete